MSLASFTSHRRTGNCTNTYYSGVVIGVNLVWLMFFNICICFLSSVETWKNRRRLLLPSISLKLMGTYYLTEYNKLNNDLVKELEVYADTGNEIDLWPLTHHAICSIFFGMHITIFFKDMP